MELEVKKLYQDSWMTAYEKPSGWIVHQTEYRQDAVTFTDLVRKQNYPQASPLHRLDRGTSGVILYANEKKYASEFQKMFLEKKITKTYQAIVRGFLAPREGLIDYPLESEKPAQTRYRSLKQIELEYPVGIYSTARYSLVEACPQEGRQHQIRRHLRHINHPIVGDVNYGDGDHNIFFRSHFKVNRLLLAATQVSFVHPFTGEQVLISCDAPQFFEKLFS